MNRLKVMSYADLNADGIVSNRTQLSRLIKNEDFPPGFLLSANSRRWTEEEVAEWLDKRRATHAGAGGSALAHIRAKKSVDNAAA